MRDFRTRKSRYVSIIVIMVIAALGCISVSAVAEPLGPPQKSRVSYRRWDRESRAQAPKQESMFARGD